MDKDTEHIYNKLFAPELIQCQSFENCRLWHVAIIGVALVALLLPIGFLLSLWFDQNNPSGAVNPVGGFAF